MSSPERMTPDHNLNTRIRREAFHGGGIPIGGTCCGHRMTLDCTPTCMECGTQVQTQEAILRVFLPRTPRPCQDKQAQQGEAPFERVARYFRGDPQGECGSREGDEDS